MRELQNSVWVQFRAFFAGCRFAAKPILWVGVLAFFLMSFSREGDEVEIIDKLVHLSEQQLSTQRELKSLMSLFKTQQDAFFKGDQTKERASEMVLTAARILKIIDAHNYRHLFSVVYLQELEMFASIANKNSPARP